MHRTFELIGAKKVGNSEIEHHLKWELSLKCDDKNYQLTGDFTISYIDNCIMDHRIDFKDDSWLDENLIEIKEENRWNS